ncbi:hypothetical protein [Ochrobactrum sp. SFR4]|uniref:hypothetical protein n=1 Tax=Ochrobactrum sp. SFR4 TaxID=2717368 RepID=UPI000EFABD80|nr:hypothetical protein [Ochrobactrum sp. SFR4]MBX8824825.1 hypothetical protein [Ochrobactrum sp. SFR4]
MRSYSLIYITALSAFAMSANAEAASTTAKRPAFTINADQTKQLSKTVSQFSGNVVIKLGATEIKTNKAKLVTAPDKITVYTDTFVATAKK